MNDGVFVFPTPEEKDVKKLAAEARRQASRRKARERRRLNSPPRGLVRQCERLIWGETRCPETFRVASPKNPKRYCSRTCKASAWKQAQTAKRQQEALDRIGFDDLDL